MTHGFDLDLTPEQRASGLTFSEASALNRAQVEARAGRDRRELPAPVAARMWPRWLVGYLVAVAVAGVGGLAWWLA